MARPHIVVLSSLAEGADQLVASVALERGAILIAPLPMPFEEYRKDFQFGLTPNALSEFDRLLARAAAAPEMPLLDGATIEALRDDARRRAMQYREAGLYIVRHCQILLALWDGDESDVKTGGTAEIVRRQREGAPLANACVGPRLHRRDGDRADCNNRHAAPQIHARERKDRYEALGSRASGERFG